MNKLSLTVADLYDPETFAINGNFKIISYKETKQLNKEHNQYYNQYYYECNVRGPFRLLASYSIRDEANLYYVSDVKQTDIIKETI